MSAESINDLMKDRVRQILFGLFLLSLGAYAYGAVTSSLFNPDLAGERTFLMTVSRMSEIDVAEMRRQAEAYWTRYKDVGRNEHFGRNGELGLYGARTHYLRHGRYEGRQWPE